MHRTIRFHAERLHAVIAVAGLCLTVTLLGHAEMLRRAAGISDKQFKQDAHDGGLGDFVAGADSLMKPARIAIVAVAPVAFFLGVGAFMVGNRRGASIVGSTFASVAILTSIPGLIN